MNDGHLGAGGPVHRGAMMLELWRRVVIGSAVAVYVTGLACAGSVLAGRIEAGVGLPSLAAFLPEPLHRPAGRRAGDESRRLDSSPFPRPMPGLPPGTLRCPSDPASRSAPSRPGRQHPLPRLRRRIPPAHEYPPPRAWPERRRVQDPLRLQPRTAADVSDARSHVCGPRRNTGLAARIRQRPILLEPELRRRGGTRSISLEELLTRREIRQREAVQRTEASAHIVSRARRRAQLLRWRP